MGLLSIVLFRPKNDLSIYHNADWWNPNGSFGILAKMNKIRVPYFVTYLNNVVDIIDLGCGGGLVTEEIARHFPNRNVTGYDISEGALNQARSHGATLVNLNYKVGSLYQIPLPENSVDGVIVSDVFEHLDDLPRALSEIHRVLKPGGILVFDTIARTWWSWLSTYIVAQEVLGVIPRGTHDWSLFINPEELKDKLIATGFTTNRSDWKGICGNISILNVLTTRSFTHVIESFYEDVTDLQASYMGYAVKPLTT